MNNQATATPPRELLDRLANAPSISAHGVALDELREFLANPVEEQPPAPEWCAALLQLEVVREAHTSRDSAERLANMDAGKVLRQAIDTLKALRASQHQGEPAKLRFPTMLRKMWSGGEVQQWLEEQGPLYRLAPVSNGDTAALRKVYDLINLSYSQPVSVLLENFRNIKRFSDLLHAVEREFFMVPGEPSDEPEDEGAPIDDECLLNCWGTPSTEHYVEQFRAALDHLHGLKLVLDRIQVRLGKEQIKAVLLANGFKEKPQADGSSDLHPYVYDAADALLALYEEAYNACPPSKGAQ